MESLKRRLKYYGIGFGIGLLFVIFFFNNRGCSWLPGNRVKNTVLDRLIVVSLETQQKMEQRGMDEQDLLEVLNDGEVLFSESDKNSDSKIYLIEKDGVRYAFTLPYESFVSEAFIGVKSKNIKPTPEGMGVIIHFPKDEDIIYPDSLASVTCQQNKLGLISPRDILKLLKASGRIDFAKTKLGERPKPVHYLVFTKDGKEVGAKAIWYKNKVNITRFESELISDCD